MKIVLLLTRIFRSPIFWIFLIAITLRLLLVIINREANDNHVEVILRVLKGLPIDNTSCWECYHPKFYYYVSAFLARLFSLDTVGIIVFSQFTSTLAGIGTLFILYFFINVQRVSSDIKQLVVALVAFNPDFAGINVQATNDSFVIFFSTTAIYMFWRYLKNQQFIFLALLTISASLAAISKGSGVVTFLALAVCLGIHTIWSKRVISLIFFCTFISMVIFFFSPYYYYYRVTGDPTTISSLPQILQRPGITSIYSGYFTFHFFDLISKPYIPESITLHRTSLWSQMYGRAYSIHFPYWPPSWVNTDIYVTYLTRIILIFALMPTAIFLTGFIRAIFRLDFEVNLMFLLISVSFVAMIIVLSYIYRDFSSMKAIYIYPALICLVYFFILGADYIKRKLINYKSISQMMTGSLVLFILLELIDIGILIYKLPKQ